MELSWICHACKEEVKNNKKDVRMTVRKLDDLVTEFTKQASIMKETVLRGLSESMSEMERKILGKLKGPTIHKESEETEETIDVLGSNKHNEKMQDKLNKVNKSVKDVENRPDAEHSSTSFSDASETFHKIIEETATYAQMAKSAEEKIMKICSRMEENTAAIDQNLIREQHETMKKFVQLQEKGDRSMNVLIHNVEESKSKNIGERMQHDIVKVREVANALGINQDLNIVKIFRLNRKHQPGQENEKKNARILLIKFKSEDESELLYNRRFNLRQYSDFDNIFISRDLSPEQRLHQRKLREELKEKGKEKYQIFRGKVVARRSQQ